MPPPCWYESWPPVCSGARVQSYPRRGKWRRCRLWRGRSAVGRIDGVGTTLSRRALWVVALLLFLGFGLPQLPAMHTMSELGTNLLSFQFVGTSERAQLALDTWGDAGRDAARAQLSW